MTLLKQYRLLNGLSQKEMAEKMGISLNAYRNYELAKRTMPLKIIYNFLKLRNLEEDKKLIKTLEELGI